MSEEAEEGDQSAEAAEGAALAIAARAGVRVHSAGVGDVQAVQEIIQATWGPQQIPQANLLRALSHAGNPVLVASRGDRPLGVTFGFLGWTDGLHLHSHMTAVVEGNESAGVGHALKLTQRALCLRSGVHEIRWTFDPMVARNAYFNLIKLGATVRDYFPNFYGEMDDTVNAGDSSDRFEVSWDLDRSPTDTHPRAADQEAHVMTGAGVRVQVPKDFVALRRADPQLARIARREARTQFEQLFALGLKPSWTADGYVFAEFTVPTGSELTR